MARQVAMLMAALIIAGCRGSNPPGPVDPFFGRTRIEPPATGSVSPRPPSDPYSPSSTHVTPSSSATGVAKSSVSSQSAGPLASSGPGDHISVPAAARAQPNLNDSAVRQSSVAKNTEASRASPSELPSTPGTSGVVPARLYQTIAPRPKTSERPIDIMDLPAADQSGNSAPPGTIQLASAAEPLKDASVGSDKSRPANAAAPSYQGLYGYDPQYRWLRGRLEYSEADRCWKLRYIPIDGVTDKYGGSVVLSNTSSLSGFERGDFVEVHGTLTSSSGKPQGFSGTFDVQQIKRSGK